MSDKDKLIQEMNQLSDNTWKSEEQRAKDKQRMVEIAKILLSEHYWYWNVLYKWNKGWENNV